MKLAESNLNRPNFFHIFRRFQRAAEQDFQRHYGTQSVFLLRSGAINAAILLAAWHFLVARRLTFIADRSDDLLVLDLCVFGLNIAHFSASFSAIRFPRLTQVGIAIGVSLFGYIVMLLAACFPIEHRELIVPAVLLMLLGNYLTLRMQFEYALASGVTFSLFVLFSEFGNTVYSGYGDGRLLLLLYLIAGNVVGITSVHLMDFLARLDFYNSSLLGQERDRSENLLLNVLPRAIAERLKRFKSSPAEDYENVTVMFADLVGFSAFAANRSAGETMGVLNDIFSLFDDAANALQVEKIKTMGDCYMAVAGLPTRRVDHADVMVEFSLQVRAALLDYCKVHQLDIGMRIGVNSGAVAAGIIGKTKFAYDLWGDTVNIASRLEGAAARNHVYVSDATKRQLSAKRLTEPVGVLTLKGVGEVRAHHVLG